MSIIDTATDFQDDAGGRDPDTYSTILQSYHQLLWSKPLPSGARFDLTPSRAGAARVLVHDSSLGYFVLSSDTLANSNRRRLQDFYLGMGDDVNRAWHRDGGTIGGRLVFPRNRIGGRQTINQARGTHPQIRDRFDLTLEAIRRHYSGESSPLSATIAGYASYFALFETFMGYVEFFLLHDLVDSRGGVRFYLPFVGFGPSPLPQSMDEYRSFRKAQLDFVAARNGRIVDAIAS